MMTEITIYHAASGVILRTMTISAGDQAALHRMLTLNLSEGEAWVEGRWPAETHRIRDGVPEQLPDRPGAWAVFDTASWSWTDPRSAADLAAEAMVALQDARASAIALVHQWIASAALPLTGGVPIEEMLSWTAKEAAAEAVVAGTATDGQALMIATEAALTGEAVADLCQIILAKAAAYSAAAGVIAGVRRTVEAQLALVTDPAACIPVAQTAIASAAAALQGGG